MPAPRFVIPQPHSTKTTTPLATALHYSKHFLRSFLNISLYGELNRPATTLRGAGGWVERSTKCGPWSEFPIFSRKAFHGVRSYTFSKSTTRDLLLHDLRLPTRDTGKREPSRSCLPHLVERSWFAILGVCAPGEVVWAYRLIGICCFVCFYVTGPKSFHQVRRKGPNHVRAKCTPKNRIVAQCLLLSWERAVSGYFH